MTNTVPCWCSEGDVCTQRVSIWENDRNEKWKSAGFALLILRLWLDVCLMLFHIINLKDPNSAKPQKAPPKKVKENAISEGFHWMKWIVFVLLMMWVMSAKCNLCSCLLHFNAWRWLIGLFVSEKMKNIWALHADYCVLCATQTPLRLNHRKSSMSFCPTRDTTFFCRWATSSPPSCYWCSLSSSSSSSHADIKPKVCKTSVWQ